MHSSGPRIVLRQKEIWVGHAVELQKAIEFLSARQKPWGEFPIMRFNNASLAGREGSNPLHSQLQ